MCEVEVEMVSKGCATEQSLLMQTPRLLWTIPFMGSLCKRVLWCEAGREMTKVRFRLRQSLLAGCTAKEQRSDLSRNQSVSNWAKNNRSLERNGSLKDCLLPLFR